jgi:DNA-binding response OmpR family regulator
MNILIVEDDDRIADFLCRGLRAEGHRVQRAADGPTGLSMAQDAARQAQVHGDVTLLLLDMMLPGLSGLEICQALRAQRIWLPILVLTAQTSLEDRVAGLRLGADDYLCKPFAFEELLARLEALARRGRDMRPPEAGRLRHGDLELHLARMQASRAGKPLSLTARELAFPDRPRAGLSARSRRAGLSQCPRRPISGRTRRAGPGRAARTAHAAPATPAGLTHRA